MDAIKNGDKINLPKIYPPFSYFLGENCSTSEIENAITDETGLRGVAVFGVEIPGVEGKAGMAVISDPQNKLDLAKFSQRITKSLPFYAIPVFIRIINNELEMTESFKVKKLPYQKVGFNIKLNQDKFFILRKSKTNEIEYVELNDNLYDNIIKGKVPF